MPKLAVARFSFCANSFNPVRTGAAAFDWQTGAAALAGAPAGSELAGVAAFLAARPDWQACVLCSASAPPGGPLQASVFGAWLAEVLNGLRAAPCDGVYLALHGAAQAEGDAAADLTILRHVRAAIGRTPLVASFHWAANLSEQAVLLLDAAAAARGWPEGGGDAAAQRALGLLAGMVAGNFRPVGVLVRAPSLAPSLAPHLVLPPMWRAELAALPNSVLETALFAGFPWADGPAAGPAALVWTDRDTALARAVATDLACRMAALAASAAPLPSPEAALAGFGPTDRFALLDPADDPACGGLADTPGLLRALLAAPPAGRAAFGVLHDPASVAAARAAGLGAELTLPLAAQATGRFGPPVRVCARVRSLARTEPCGTLAVLQCGRLQIVLAERRPPRIDADLFAQAGVRLAGLRLLAAKAGEASRAEFAAAFPHVLVCAAPGPAAAGLLRLPAMAKLPDRRSGRRAASDQVRAH